MDYAKNNRNTPVLVTADHECGCVVLGAIDPCNYPAGTGPIFGSGMKKVPGPGYNLTVAGTEATHSAIDVPVRAMGPGAEKITQGMIGNTQIFEFMKEALGL